MEHPWNWIKVISGGQGITDPDEMIPGDHAGIWETSALMAVHPECVRTDHALDSGEWFCESGKDATAEIGEDWVAKTLKNLDRIIKRPITG